MEAAHVARRLAAVLVADVAGYSRLMERDEAGTHFRIQALVAGILAPSIARHHGRLLKVMGDGVLADFASATDAVRCAVDIQRQSRASEAATPDRDRTALRIGVNVADVLFDAADIAGDGVNLAARLQTLAQPGGICISRAVRDQIHEDLGVAYVYVGTKHVKNISKPVAVFRVLLDPPSLVERISMTLAGPHIRRLGAALATALVVVAALVVWQQYRQQDATEILSLRVGQFRSALSGDADAGRVAELMSQRIYLALSPERHVLKIKRVQTDEGTPSRNAPAARYVVEGVVTSIDGSFRVDTRLVDAQSREALWGDVFNLRDASVGSVELGAWRISHALHHEVVQHEMQRLRARAPGRPDSMELYLMALASWGHAPAERDHARRLLERALAADSRNVPALLSLAALSDDREQDRLTLKAVTTDPLCADSWVARSQVLVRSGQLDAGREALDRALRINPANAYANTERDLQRLNDGRWESVVKPLEDVEFEYAKTQYFLREALSNQCLARLLGGKDAAAACDRWFAATGSQSSLVFSTAAAARKGEAKHALRAGAMLRERYPGLTLAAHREMLRSQRLYSQRFLDELEAVVYPALRTAGIPER